MRDDKRWAPRELSFRWGGGGGVQNHKKELIQTHIHHQKNELKVNGQIQNLQNETAEFRLIFKMSDIH